MSQNGEHVCKILIVGGVGGTNVGDSLRRGGLAIGRETEILNATDAMAQQALAQRLLWRFADRRPYFLNSFSEHVVARAKIEGSHVVIATGAAPMTQSALLKLRALGVHSSNYSTDDPFNPVHAARWHLRSLREYDVVFTPRRANVEDLMALGCRDVRYLPFGYDEELFKPPRSTPADGDTGEAPHVLFVGGADRDRAGFFADFVRVGPKPLLVGSYWERYHDLREVSIGQKPPESLRALTAGAAVNLCLVRRANRDGHVMRSFEIPAVGGFMLAEDTAEHREIFGEEGRCVLYFQSPQQAATKAIWALRNPVDRQRMAAAAHRHVTYGQHTYRHRLQQMLTVISAEHY